MYYLKTLFQFLIFFILFMVTHYWMSREDVFNVIPFKEALPLVIFSSAFVGLAVVFLIQILSFSPHLLIRILGFSIGLLQIYLNFTYFEYFIVFKTPILGSDIIYMEEPASIWQLAEESVWNIRFPFFVLLPAVALALTQFALPVNLHRRFVFQSPPWPIKVGGWVVILVCGFLLFFYQQKLEDRLVKVNWGEGDFKKTIADKRNPLIMVYESIANYLRIEKNEIPRPTDITRIRDLFLDREKREFIDPEYPLIYRGKPPSPKNHKNIIIIMLESFPQAEFYGLSKNPDYAGSTPFLDKLLQESLYFPHTYATGIHTFYGISDLFTGTASYREQSWNRKIGIDIPYTLPRLLERNGYRDRGWYYGGKSIHFDFMLTFASGIGFNRLRFYNSFPRRAKKANWGKSDRETLMLAAREIRDFSSPFLVYVLSLTKHGPWNTPPEFDHAGFARDYLSRHEGEIPNPGLRNSQRLVYYYDQILKEFFHTLKDEPHFKNSLVIITSDQAFFPDIRGEDFYHTMKNGFNIPLLFYEPGEKTLPVGKSEVFASHLDILPTLIDYLGLTIPETIPYQGRSLFREIPPSDEERYSHIAFWQNDLIHFARNRFYKLSSDPKLNTILQVDSSGESLSNDPEINRMMTSFKSVYPYLIKNNLVFPTSQEGYR